MAEVHDTPGLWPTQATHCSPSQILSDQLTLSQASGESGHHEALSWVTGLSLVTVTGYQPVCQGGGGDPPGMSRDINNAQYCGNLYISGQQTLLSGEGGEGA